MPSSNIALLTPDGPNGKLERCGRPRMDRLESREVPIQNGYRWIDDTEYGVVMSAWNSTPATSEMLPFFQHELMLVVDGSVTIIEPDGRETTVRAGGCFVFPQGCVRQWKQTTEYFRKFAVVSTTPHGRSRPTPPPCDGYCSTQTGAWSRPAVRRQGR